MLSGFLRLAALLLFRDVFGDGGNGVELERLGSTMSRYLYSAINLLHEVRMFEGSCDFTICAVERSC